MAPLIFKLLEDCLLLEIPYITSHDEGDENCVFQDSDWSLVN